MNKLFLFLSVCVLMFISGCSDEQKAKPSSSSSLVLGVMPSMDYLPLAVAQREGYFNDLDLDILIIRFYSANERDAAFQSRNIDGTVIDYTGAVLQKSGGLDLKLTSRCDAPFYLMARPGSDIGGIAGLKSAKIAVSRNTVIDYFVDAGLRSAGMTAEDVEKLEINQIPTRYEMLMAGKIDCTGLPDPLATLAHSQGASLLRTNRDLGLSITGIMFSGKALVQKNEQIKKMYQAYNRGVEYLRRHGPEDVRDILISQMNFKEELIPLAILPVYEKASLPPMADLRSVADWLAGRGLIAKDFSVESLADGSVLPE